MTISNELATAQALSAKEPQKAIAAYKQLYEKYKGKFQSTLNHHRITLTLGTSEEDLKIKELCVVKLGELYRNTKFDQG